MVYKNCSGLIIAKKHYLPKTQKASVSVNILFKEHFNSLTFCPTIIFFCKLYSQRTLFSKTHFPPKSNLTLIAHFFFHSYCKEQSLCKKICPINILLCKYSTKEHSFCKHFAQIASFSVNICLRNTCFSKYFAERTVFS